MDLEDLFSGVRTEFGEATIQGDTMGFEVFAEQELTTPTVETFIAKLGVAVINQWACGVLMQTLLSNNTLANIEALNSRANGRYNTDSLVA